MDRSNIVGLTDEITRRLSEAQSQRPVETGGGDGHGSGMGLAERLARVEAAIEGLRHSQNLTVGATVGIGGIIAAFVIGFGVYSLQRIDGVDAKIDSKFDTLTLRLSEESARTRQDLIGIATAISGSITAAKQPASTPTRELPPMGGSTPPQPVQRP